jgi:hypothetical protein
MAVESLLIFAGEFFDVSQISDIFHFLIFFEKKTIFWYFLNFSFKFLP